MLISQLLIRNNLQPHVSVICILLKHEMELHITLLFYVQIFNVESK